LGSEEGKDGGIKQSGSKKYGELSLGFLLTIEVSARYFMALKLEMKLMS
jgi:hypothetical protein